MSYLARNLAALHKSHGGTAKYLRTHFSPKGSLQIETARNGEKNARLRGVFVHSTHNPTKEAQRIINSLVNNGAVHLVFWGFGLGYYVEAFVATKNWYQQGVVVIPDGNDLLQALHTRDMHSTISDDSIRWLIEGSATDLELLLHQLSYQKIEEVPIHPLLQGYSTQCTKLRNIFARFNTHRSINIQSYRAFGKLWMQNLTRNIPYLATMNDIRVIKDIFKGIPALLIGAGPTLDSLVDLISTLQEHTVLIAVDTALQPLAYYGITPDIIVIVDPQYWNSRYLDYINSVNSLVICDPSTYHRNIRNFHTQGYYFASRLPFAQLIHNAMGVNPSIAGGGSVVTAAWEVAKWIGASSVLLGGIDFGYPHHRVHSLGCYFEEQMHLRATRCHPAEHDYAQYLYNGDHIVTHAASGDTILSDRRLQTYKDWIGARVSQPGSPPTFTLSLKSAHIPGVDPVLDIRTLKLPRVRRTVSAIINKYTRNSSLSPAAEHQNISALKTSLSNYHQILNRLDTQLHQIIEEVPSISTPKGVANQSIPLINTLHTIMESNPYKDILSVAALAPEYPPSNNSQASTYYMHLHQVINQQQKYVRQALALIT